MKSTFPDKTNLEQLSNVVVDPFLCIENLCLYAILTICRFPEKTLNKIFFFIINVGYEDTKIGKGHTLAYLIPFQYESYSVYDENSSEKVMHDILATVSETEVEMLSAIPVCRS